MCMKRPGGRPLIGRNNLLAVISSCSLHRLRKTARLQHSNERAKRTRAPQTAASPTERSPASSGAPCRASSRKCPRRAACACPTRARQPLARAASKCKPRSCATHARNRDAPARYFGPSYSVVEEGGVLVHVSHSLVLRAVPEGEGVSRGKGRDVVSKGGKRC